MYGIDPPLMTYGGMIICRQLTWPCENATCERYECVRAKAVHPSSQGPAKPADHDEWQCMHYDSGCRCKCTWCQARNGKPVTAPVELVQVLCGPDGQWSITGLSEEDLWTLYGALGVSISEAMSYHDTSDGKRYQVNMIDVRKY